MEKFVLQIPTYDSSLESLGERFVPFEYDSKEGAEQHIIKKFIEMINKEKSITVFGVEFSNFWYLVNDTKLPVVLTMSEWFSQKTRCQFQTI